MADDAAKSSQPHDSASKTPNSSQAEQQWTPETGTSSPLPFFHLLERLKTTKREGWRRFGISGGESIADHMYRMAMMTLVCPAGLARQLDISRCTAMALVHDVAESLVGDITPVDGIPKNEKSRREAATVEHLCAGLLGGVEAGDAGVRIATLWREYEDGATLESRFVHDVDKVELLLQMLEYERTMNAGVDLGEFAHVAGRILLPELQVWAKDLLAERAAFWATAAPGATPKGLPDNTSSERRRAQQDEYYGGPPASRSNPASSNGAHVGTSSDANGA